MKLKLEFDQGFVYVLNIVRLLIAFSVGTTAWLGCWQQEISVAEVEASHVDVMVGLPYVKGGLDEEDAC